MLRSLLANWTKIQKNIRRDTDNQMKKIITILMLSSLIFLCACGGGRQLKGTYRDNLGFSTLVFDGNNVTSKSLNGESKGTYKFDGDTLKIEYEGGTHDEYFYDEKSDTLDWYGSGIVIFSKSN